MLVQANVEDRTCVFAVVVAAEVIKTLFLKQTSGLSRDYDSSKPIKRTVLFSEHSRNKI